MVALEGREPEAQKLRGFPSSDQEHYSPQAHTDEMSGTLSCQSSSTEDKPTCWGD